MNTSLKDNYYLVWLEIAILFVSLAGIIWGIHTKPLHGTQAIFLIIFSLLALASLLATRYSFMVFYLLSTFFIVALWRLSALAHLEVITWIITVGMIIKLLNYIRLAYISIQYTKRHASNIQLITAYQWQLMFIRLYIGFDLIPHFCEKLFAGAAVRLPDIQSFITLHVAHPVFMVFLAGWIEFFGALAMACGLMTRIASICLAIYLLYAIWIGGNFSDGFVWVSKGGGWEFPVLWSVLILTYATFGAGKFSIDQWFKDHYNLPKWIKMLMGGAPIAAKTQQIDA